MPLRLRACLVGDETHTLLAVEDHLRLAQLLLVIGEARNIKRLRRHEAMAARLLAAPYPVDLERDHLAIEQAKDGVQRTHPAELAAPPPHRLGPREGPHDLRHDLRDHL